MKKNNNALGKIALVTAAVGIGTYVYKKFINKNSEKDEAQNRGVVEIEDLEDVSCDCSKDDKNENSCCCGSPSEETDSSFEIKLDNLNKEDSSPKEEEKKEEGPIE